MSVVKVNSSWLVPTHPLRMINEERVEYYRRRFRHDGKVEPLACAEKNGALLIIDGHHRWIANVLEAGVGQIEINILLDREVESVFGLSSELYYRESLEINIYDWEEVVKFPLGGDRKLPLASEVTIILTGPSGVGKSTALEALLSQHDNYEFMVSTTARPKRTYETEGAEYEFLTSDEFQRRIAIGAFSEWQYVHGTYYGMRKTELEKSDRCKISDFDIHGALLLKRMYPRRVYILFLDVTDSSVLRERLEARDSESPAEISLRLARTRRVRELSRLCDYQIAGDTPKEVATSINCIAKLVSFSTIGRENLPNRSHEICELRIRDQDQLIYWANNYRHILPSVRLKEDLSVHEGFRLLEMIVFDQLSSEVLRIGTGKHLPREFCSAAVSAAFRCITEPTGKVRFVKEIEIKGMLESVCDGKGLFGVRRKPNESG